MSKSVGGHPGDHQNQNQVLLKALQEFIIPHVDAAVEQKTRNEMNQRLLGPEATNLITALKEFISSIICSSPPEVNTMIEANLGSHKDDHESTDSEEDSDFDVADLVHQITSPHRKDAAIENALRPQGKHQYVSVSAWYLIDNTAEKPEPTFHDKVLSKLRDRVFNKMPIRLLRFEPQGSRLQISLIERGAIYSHLESIMCAKMHDRDYCRLDNDRYGRLETDDEAVSRLVFDYGGYAILSHTWLRSSPGEVNYNNWNKGIFNSTDPGYKKLVNFCNTAWHTHKLTLGWMDTICINKDSSSELDESIRSMYNWYTRAKICIIYLAETREFLDMRFDPWFTRGWTLQELIAPDRIKFYNSNWEQLVRESNNDKKDDLVAEQIMKATTMSANELNNMRFVTVSRKMQLAATREVTREEDTAYSLMGIFNVSISTAYGEGAQRAFTRLVEEILRSKIHGILDLFNCADAQSSNSASSILPQSPRQYLCRSSVRLYDFNLRPLEPLTLTHMDIRIPVLLMPGIAIKDTDSLFKPIGDYGAIIPDIHDGYSYSSNGYRLLDNKVTSADNPRRSTQFQYTFAVFNVQQDTQGIIFIPETCIAFVIRCYEDVGQVTSTGKFERNGTRKPVVFEMLKRNPDQVDESAEDYMVLARYGIHIPPEELTSHGMQLISKYL